MRERRRWRWRDNAREMESQRMEREDAEASVARRRRRGRDGAQRTPSRAAPTRHTRKRALIVLLSLLGIVHGFEVPEVEWIYPIEGHVGGGEVVTLSGQALTGIQGLNGVELTCKFDNDFVPAFYVSSDTVRCTAPAHSEGFVNVEFALNNETGDFYQTKGYQFVSGAKVDTVFSIYGVAGGIVDVVGIDMHVSQFCRFGDRTTIGHVVSSSLMRCESPTINDGIVDVDVSLSSSSFFEGFSSVQHVYTPLPSITRLLPSSGVDEGGTVLTVTGTSFASTSLLRCRLGTVDVDALWKTANTLECVAPASKPLTVELRVSMNQRDYSSVAGSFKYYSRLAIDAVLPSQISGSSSTLVAIQVPGIAQTLGLMCKFGAHAVAGSVDGAAVKCLAPAGVGFQAISIASNGQDFDFSFEGREGVQLDSKAVAEIHRITPRVGATGGGTLVYVEGQHLLNDNPVCRFGSLTVWARRVSSALWVCETPSMLEGMYALDVSVVATSVELAMRPQFLSDSSPVVTAISPSMGLVEGGTTVTAAGHSFSDTHELSCKFGTIGPVVGEFISEDEYRCLTPAHVHATVVFNIGMFSEYSGVVGDADVRFMFVEEASVTTVINNNDNTATVTGSGFLPGQDVYCNLGNGDALVPGVVQSDGSVLCGLPEDNSGVNEYNIRIVDSSGNNVVAPTDANDIETMLTVLDQMLPWSGPSIGGMTVTVRGEHFSPSALCRFGSLTPFPSVFISSAEVVCETPDMQVGHHQLAVSNNAFDWSIPGLPFEFMNTSSSTVNGVTPSSGSEQGGSVLTMNGLAFRNDVSLAFRFGTISGIAGRWFSATEASCVSPSHAVDDVPVNVFHHNSGSEIKVNDASLNYSYKSEIVLTSVVPSFAFVSGGAKVSFFGDNFYGNDITCTFGSVPVAAFASSGQSICSAPVSRSGFTVVEISMNMRDFVSSEGEFQYVTIPKVDVANPFAVPSIGGSLVFLTGKSLMFEADEFSPFCEFATATGSSRTVAIAVSSALIVCVTPAKEGDSTLKLSYRDFEPLPGLTFRFDTLPVVDADHPAARGFEQGGAVLDIFGDFSTVSTTLGCKVGTIIGVPLIEMSSEQVSCIMPAHAPGLIGVAVVMNDADVVPMSLLYDYMVTMDVAEPCRSSISMDGATLIELPVLQNNWPAQLLNLKTACVVDLKPIMGSITSNGLVSCIVPPHSSGFVSVRLHIQETTVLSSFSTQLHYQTQAQIFGLQPREGSVAGGEIIKLTGNHFDAVFHSAFLFGRHSISSAVQFVSSTLMIVEQPASESGSALLAVLESQSVSVAADEFSSTGVIFLFSEEQDAPVHVSPERSSEAGGVLATVYFGSDLQPSDNAACRFGTIGPIFGRMTATGLECGVPAHNTGTVSVYARLMGEMFTTLQLVKYGAFRYESDVHILSSAIYPLYGSIDGGSYVRILHDDPLENQIYCHIGGKVVLASAVLPVFPVQSECLLPSYVAGFVQINLGGVPGVHEMESMYMFQSNPLWFSSFPTQVTNVGGELVSITGTGFIEMHKMLATIVCIFGHSSVPAHVHSSALISCETPFFADTQGTVVLYVVHSGDSHLDDSTLLSITYLAVPTILDMLDDVVSSAGGDVLKIAAMASATALAEFADSPIARVGTTGPIYVRPTGSIMELIMPAKKPAAVVDVWLSARSSTPHTLSFIVMISEISSPVLAIPSRSAIDGGSVIYYRVFGHNISSAPLGCSFGLLTVESTQVSKNVFCQGSNQRDCVSYDVTCITPAQRSGFVGLSVPRFEGADIDFEIFVPPHSVWVHPQYASASGTSFIYVMGQNLHEGGSCHFGSDVVDSRFISSALSVCVSPVPLKGRTGSFSSVSLSISPLEDALQVSDVRKFRYIDDMVLSNLSPSSGNENGGTYVKFEISYAIELEAVKDVSCRFGSIGPIVGEVQSETTVLCVSPASIAGQFIAGLTYGLQGFYAYQREIAQFTYFSPPHIASVVPTRGVQAGGTEVMFTGTVGTTLDNSYSLFCKFGGLVVPATYFDTYVGRCFSPAGFAGFTALEIVVENDGVYDEFMFEIFVAPVVLDVQPMVGTANGATVLHIQGINLHEAGACLFDDTESSVVHFVSSAISMCLTLPANAFSVYPPRRGKLVRYSPAANVYTVPLGISSRDDVTHMTMFNTTVPFRYINDLKVTGMIPATGSKAGGSGIELSMTGMEDNVDYSCRVGTIFPIKGFRTQDAVLTCVTPAHELGDVDVDVSGNGRDTSTLSAVVFAYQVPPRISGIVPRVGLSGGRSPIFITGTNFVNSTTLTCRFGKEISRATFLSQRSMLCIAGLQQTGTRTVYVDVSNNGKDFSDQRLLFHFAQCPSGSYCPDSEPIPCPRGAFCGGGKSFTLCPAGTFQPRIGQADCLPTPVGFISPDAGAMMPLPCPRGAVCDSTGLSVPSKLCPPGHYCLEGTRTSNFTDFSIAERPLPCPFGMYCMAGVVSEASIAYNFSTPQQCYSGYVCEAGSITPQGTGPCPPGHYCPVGEQLICPKRMYCPGVANSEPKPCLPGEYNFEFGRSSCRKCPKGTVCPGFARELPEVCTPGFVCDTEGLAVAGTRCPAGHYCLENTVSVDPLAIIDAVSILAASPISLDPDNFRPKPCPPTTFCTQGVSTDVILEGSFKQPQPCKEGSYCEWATGDSTVTSDSAADIYNPMRPCPAGYYCPKGTYIPIPAPRGSYTSGTGNAAATKCLPGLYTPYEGFKSCLACSSGYECVDEGTSKPLACQPGYFRSARDSISCRLCPKGTWSGVVGLTEESLCLPCNAGLVCAIDGTSNNKPIGIGTAVTNEYAKYCDEDNSDYYDESKCVRVQLQEDGQAELCPEGLVCDARTSAAEEKCPNGYYCGFGTTPATQFANPCPAGYYCPPGSAYSTRKQFPCQPCFYCPEGTGQVLQRCPTGTESVPLATSIDACLADQITFWRVMPINFNLIESVYWKLLNGTSLSTAAKEQVKLSIDAGRRLLQLDAPAPPPPPPAVSSDGNNTTPTDPFSYIGIGACSNTNWDLLNPTFILSSDGITVGVDENNIPLMKFTLKRGHTARITMDWRETSDELIYGEHFEFLIFTNPVIDDTLCAENDYKTVPCPPWDTADGITWLDMKEIPGLQTEKKCPASQESLELPFWFNRNNDQTSTGFNVPNPAWGSYVWKRGLHELNLHALDDMPFRIEVRMLHGRYQKDNIASFLNTVCIDVSYPSRAADPILKKEYSIHAILPFTVDADYEAPLNAPVGSSFYRSVPNDYFACSTPQQDSGCRLYDARVTIDYNSTVGAEWKKFKYLKQKEIITDDDAPSQSSINVSASSHIEDWVIVDPDNRQDETVLLSIPDVTERQTFLTDAALWQSEQNLFAMDYMPFFSACRGYDSHIYFQHFTENDFVPVSFGPQEAPLTFVSYGESELVATEDVVFINQFNPQVQKPVADAVSITLDCFYEEDFTQASAKKRWYESEGDTLFHLTAEAESQSALFEASILANEQTEPPINRAKYVTLIVAQESIPVVFAPADGIVVGSGMIPTTMSFDILYYQLSPTDKRLVSASVTMDAYVSANSHDGTYSLTITTGALGWFDLLNFFAFDLMFYLILFIAIGSLAVLLNLTFWIVVRLFTLVKDPPRFRFLPYLKLMIGPPIVGVALGLAPFVAAQLGLRVLFGYVKIITEFPISIDNVGRELDPAVVEKATSGRFAVCFMTVSMYMMGCCAEIMIPSAPKGEDDEIHNEEVPDEYANEVMFRPEVWKRSHFVLLNLLVNATNVFLIEFSFTNTFGVQFFTVFFLLKVVHILLEMQIETALGEAYLLSPVSLVLAASVGTATIGANDFTDFTLGFFFETILAMIEYVYLDAFIAYASVAFPNAIGHAITFIKKAWPFKKKKQDSNENDEDDEPKDAIETEDTLVEDLMGFLAAYGVNTANLYMTPAFIYFFWDFNDQLRLSYLYGFRKKDLLIYLLFAVVIIPFQIVMDILMFNIQELFHGWKVYEYLKYARYRFLNRTTRWKGLERVYDESIDPGLRAIDHMCFSSQYYFVITLGGSGSFLFVLSLSMMLRANYNMFEDILFVACIVMILGVSFIIKKVMLFLCNLAGLWKITSSVTAGDMIQGEDELEDDFVAVFVPVKNININTNVTGGRTTTKELLTADLTSDSVRHLFMSENRDWVLDQLREILTPRTAKRLKYGKAVRRRRRSGFGSASESDSDEEADFGDVKLSDDAQNLMRTWIAHALARARGRGSNLLMLSDTSESETEAGIQRFQPIKLSEGSSAAMTGWLSAVRQLRMNRKASLATDAVFSSTDFSSGSDIDSDSKFSSGPMDVSAMSRGVMLDWLAHVRAMRGSMPPFERTNIISDDDSSDLSSSGSLPRSDAQNYEEGGMSGLASSIMNEWLRTARSQASLIPARSKSTALRPKREMSSSESSDLESSSSDRDLPFDTKRAKNSTLSLVSSNMIRDWLRLAKEKASQQASFSQLANSQPLVLSESDFSDGESLGLDSE